MWSKLFEGFGSIVVTGYHLEFIIWVQIYVTVNTTSFP